MRDEELARLVKENKYIHVADYEAFLDFQPDVDEEVLVDPDGYGLSVKLDIDVDKAFGLNIHYDMEFRTFDYAQLIVHFRYGRCPDEPDSFKLYLKYFDNQPGSEIGNFEKEVFMEKLLKICFRNRFDLTFHEKYDQWPYRYCRERKEK